MRTLLLHRGRYSSAWAAGEMAMQMMVIIAAKDVRNVHTSSLQNQGDPETRGPIK